MLLFWLLSVLASFREFMRLELLRFLELESFFGTLGRRWGFGYYDEWLIWLLLLLLLLYFLLEPSNLYTLLSSSPLSLNLFSFYLSPHFPFPPLLSLYSVLHLLFFSFELFKFYLTFDIIKKDVSHFAFKLLFSFLNSYIYF